MIVHLVLEGHLEEPVAIRLVEHCGHEPGRVYGRKGFVYIKDKAHMFHSLAYQGCGVLVLTDFMDSGCACVVDAQKLYLLRHVATPSKHFLLRFPVPELESWLLADRTNIATFLAVGKNRIPTRPDEEVDPKRTLVNIARRSRQASVVNGIVPPLRHGGVVAPGYLGFMKEFVTAKWDIESARITSPSLDRCVRRLQELGGHT